MAAALCCLMACALLPHTQPAQAAAAEPASYYLQYKAEAGGCTLELYLNTPAGSPTLLSGSFGLSYPAAATLSFQSGEAVNLLWDNSASDDATLVDDSTREYYVFSWARVTTDEGLLHIGTFTVAAADALDIEKFSLLDWAKTREAGDETGNHAPDEEIWRVADVGAGETQGAYQGFYGGTNGLFVQTDIPFDAPTTGVIVSGKVSSYDPKRGLTVNLYRMSDNGQYELTPINFVTTPGEKTGSGQCIQDFSVPNVERGIYKIEILKLAHVKVVIEKFTVDTDNMDLTLSNKPEFQKVMLPVGDVNGDGEVTALDCNELKAKDQYGLPIAVAKNKLCDINGDGEITALDYNLMRSFDNYGRNTIFYQYSNK